MKMKVINKEVIEVLKNEKTKIASKVLNCLDKDRVYIVKDEEYYYLEGRAPNYVYNYINKLLTKFKSNKKEV